MPEKHVEREQNPPEEIALGDKERAERIVDEYLEEHPGFSEVTDGNIDEILSRLIEKGAELSPAVKRSLRNAVRYCLGIRLDQRR